MTNATVPAPKSLIEAVVYFADNDRSFEFVKNLRWANGGVACPRCGVTDPIFVSTRRIWKCRGCKRQFSLKVGTIFEDSPLGFEKWLPAVWLIANSKNSVSSHELGRALHVTQRTAWFMLHRIREAMATGSFVKLTGTVELDETYIGGLAKNMHKADRTRKIHGTGGTDKVAVQGALVRGGAVHAEVLPTTSNGVIRSNVVKWTDPSATLYTDGSKVYNGLTRETGRSRGR
jgi:transposase-like protein